MLDWHRWVGDPTLLGWVTTLSYLAAAWLSMRASRVLEGDPLEDMRLVWAWRALSLLLLLLGLNKQLDLQTPATGIASFLARREGLVPEDRQSVVWAVRLVGVSSATAALSFTWWLRHNLRRIAPAVAGVAAILLYVVLRVSLFHRVRVVPGYWRFQSVTWLLELGGIYAIARSALREARPRPLPAT